MQAIWERQAGGWTNKQNKGILPINHTELGTHAHCIHCNLPHHEAILVLCGPSQSLCCSLTSPTSACPGLWLRTPILSINMCFTADLIQSCGVKYIGFTNDSQIYIPITDFFHERQTLLPKHLLNSPTWMSNGHLKLTMSKTPLLS